MNSGYIPDGSKGSGVPGSPEMVRLLSQWENLNGSTPKCLAKQEFNERKLGLFIHWGLYSLLGGVWHGRRMEEGGEGPTVAEWIMRRKSIPRREYQCLAEKFNPVDFDATEWVSIIKAAGLKYLVITAKHHEGFALFDSRISEFNSVKASPFRRDIIRELERACHKEGIAFGVYYSHALDWMDGGDGGMKDYGPGDPGRKTFPNFFDPVPEGFDQYIAKKSLPQVKELLHHYQLFSIFFDTPLFIPPHYSYEFYKTVFDVNPGILVSERVGNGMGDIGTPGDNSMPERVVDKPVEVIATTNNSWGFNSYDNDWKSPLEILYLIIEAVSKGANFLLNVGPTGTGRFPEPVVANLLEVGQWLQVNGDAIYGSSPWKINKEGPTQVRFSSTEQRQKERFDVQFSSGDVWFTAKQDRVYAISLVRPGNRRFHIQSLQNASFSSINLLGEVGKVSWHREDDRLIIDLPEFQNPGIGFVLEFNF